MQPQEASYSITGPRSVKGRGPVAEPIVLPTGTYRVRVEEPLCAPYSDETVRVTKGENTPLRVRLICGG